ncbi:MAG TPA: CRTAC1 family protein, partial [Gemmataceae bacterium]
DVTRAAGLPETVWPNGTAGEFLKREEPIPWASSATFLDYDGDARLDLFVCHYVTWSPAVDLRIEATLAGLERAYVPPTQFEGAQCALYRNADGRRFEDVSAEAGVQVFVPEGVGTGARQRSVGKSLGVVVCDPDADGWPDVIVANDTVQNFFFHNVPAEDGRGRRFEEIGLIAGVAYAEGTARGGMGIDWGEYRPGRCAAVIANFSNEPTTFLGLDSPQRLLFSDNALAVGLYGPTRLPLKFGTFFFDYDLDGRLDLLTANGHLEPEITKVQQSQTYAQPAQLFWNTGRRARQFEPVTEKDAGPDLFKPIVGRGSAFADIDRDGDLDVVLTANNGPPLLLRNDQKLGHHWVRLVLEGDGERSNRSAVGAEVELHAGGEVQRRSVRAGRGYLSQSELPLTFGLGKADKIDRVVVRWPGRDTEAQEWKDLAADREHVLKQKAGGTD